MQARPSSLRLTTLQRLQLFCTIWSSTDYEKQLEWRENSARRNKGQETTIYWSRLDAQLLAKRCNSRHFMENREKSKTTNITAWMKMSLERLLQAADNRTELRLLDFCSAVNLGVKTAQTSQGKVLTFRHLLIFTARRQSLLC